MEYTEIFKAHSDKLENHEGRIGTLEKSDAKQGEQIKNLCEKISNLTGWVKALVVSIISIGGSMILALIGFVFWYIQSLPKG